MGYMEIRGNKRSISFTPGDTYFAKNSLGLPQYIEVPEAIGKNTFLSDLIVEGNKKRIEQEEKDGAKYVEVIAKLTEIIQDKQSDVNQKTEQIRKIEHIFDSKQRAWKALQIIAEKEGMQYNAETGKWEPKN